MTAPLSAWASERAHRALGHTTDKAARLAIALGSIRSLVRVVDRTVPALTVSWASVNDDAVIRAMSYTDIKGGHIRLNPLPILDGTLDHGDALDVCFGFALHEASHSQESRSRFDDLFTKTENRVNTRKFVQETPAFEPMRVAAYLWNVVEDVRIEGVTSGHWPGFAPYFDKVLGYMWSDITKSHELPVEYGPDLATKLRVVFLACRYPDRLPEPVKDEARWWQDWQADYLAERADTKETIRRALDHLAEDQVTKDELTKQMLDERKERERGEKVRAQLERLMREGIPGTYGVCINDEGEVTPLDAETAEAVEQLVAEGLVERMTVISTPGVAAAPVRVRRPVETDRSKRAYVGRPDATVEALRTALVFRNSAPRYDIKLQRSGVLDDEELYRWGMGDNRVFSERVIEAKPDVFMGLLVDVSGSMMNGRKIVIAQRLAQLLTWAVHDQEGIETAVWAHTADVDEPAAEVYRIWAKGDPLSRLGLISALPHSNNRDSFAIETVVRSMLDAEQPERVLIVLADGQPSAYGYGGQPAINHVRAVTRWAAGQGVRVLQLAIDDYDLRPAEQVAMFGQENVILYHDEASLPRQLAQVIRGYLS